MARYLCLLFFCVNSFSIAIKAQCSFTGTVQTTESRCKESGTITINMMPAAAYAYQITAGPKLTPITSANVFGSLPAGTYTVTVTLGGCSVNLQATIAGNYQEPSLLSATVKNIACPSGFGSIVANEPLNGRSAYQYGIINGPVTRPMQNSPSFYNLPAGTYTLQAVDSCGIIRTSDFGVAYDTGKLHAYAQPYDVRYNGCNDLIICPIAGFSETNLHSLMMVWYIKPNGDTLKVNGFEEPVLCDTLVGEAHTYGNWKIIGFDTCGRKVESTLALAAPTQLAVNLFKYDCNGPIYNMTNLWKYGQQVGYRVRRCDNGSVVYDVIQNPSTTFYSPDISLDFNTCYLFEHWNSCGDTVSITRTTVTRPLFKIQAFEGTACNVNGKGSIGIGEVNLTGVKPITFTIISGPEGIGMTAVQTQYTSYEYLRDLALGTYAVAAEDACGNRDTISITLTKPLIRNVQITQTPNCGAGATVHVKIISNYNSGAFAATDAKNITYITTNNPKIQAVNIQKTPPTSTAPSVWEADYFNVPNGNFYLQTFADGDGCEWDTTVVVDGYIAPVIANGTGYLCETSGIGIINYTLTGGKNPFRYRIRPQGTQSWSPWQSSTTFTNISAGSYDVNVEDACPNGSITSISFQPWVKSNISITPVCANAGQSVTLAANPNIDGINYEWFFNGVIVGVGANFTITNYQATHSGEYTLMQSFPFGTCKDSAKITVLDCRALPVKIEPLSGEFLGSDIRLNWATQHEETGLYFEIEKSVDGRLFKKIALMQAANVSNGKQYNFIDNSVSDLNFYRIKYITADGKIGYTNVVKVAAISIGNDNMRVAPNPSNKDVIIHFYNTKATAYTIKVTDVLGKEIYRATKNAVAGANAFLLQNNLVHFQKGIYVIEIRSAKKVFTQKILRF
jgi:hypothetical protein